MPKQHLALGHHRQAAAKLFFLSNKSQEQITQEYRSLSGELHFLQAKIAEFVAIGRST